MRRGKYRLNLQKRMNAILMALLAVSMVTAIGTRGFSQGTTTIKGTIIDEAGIPLPSANVTLWVENDLVATDITTSDGFFEFEASLDALYVLIVMADDQSTPGMDYLPARVEVTASEGAELLIALEPAASLLFESDIQFVETPQPPITIYYFVQNPVSGKILERNGVPLIFGKGELSQSKLLGLSENHLVVPAGEPFKVGVNCSILVGGSIEPRYFEVNAPELFELGVGALLRLDIRFYSLQPNLDALETLLEEVEAQLDEMDAYGFYTVAERATVTDGERWLTEAEFLHENRQFVESFDAIKRGYIRLVQTRSRLVGMIRDASLSVYILILFFALSSTTIAFLLANRDTTKILGGVFVYTLSLFIFYNAYPGSVIISAQNFLGTSLLAIGLSLTVAILLPKFMKGRSRDGYVPVRNMIVPLFSLAKRSMRRRRLRFLLTLTSITVLVMSFVSLTSFSEGYGLIMTRVSDSTSDIDAVLVRSSGYTDIEPVFISPADATSGWLERQPESLVVSRKAENFPLDRPIARLNRMPILGVLGIDPVLEASITGINHALIEGELPSGDGIAISETLRNAMGVEIGDTLQLTGMDVTLIGILDDNVLSSLTEVEGSSFLPGKLVNLSSEGEVPIIVVMPCEPSEVVVLPISRAVNLPTVGISRIAIKVRAGVATNDFAVRLALEREYWAWATSSEGIYYARLGSYLEGKGLSLVVPWGIVVLNVVVTMLNSMYERRKEIHILSSVGLNPAQIAAIFVAEATILGLTAGALGYLAGLGVYKGLGFLNLALEVRQKISAVWSLAAIGIAMTAVLIGAFSALKTSVVITPSLQRKWQMESEMRTPFEPFEMIIPVKLLPSEVDPFIKFMIREINRLASDPTRKTATIKVFGKTEDAERRVDFVYKMVGSATSNFYSKNSLLVEKTPDDAILVKLKSDGERKWVRTTGSMIRMLAMRWSVS